MSEFNYLTGRPELFENAPADALVVLEHEDGRLFYAIAHDLGAKYWNEDGSLGSKVGLIALHKKTRVIASRVRTGGLRPAEPKRDPIPKSRFDRIQQAQNSLKKAVSQPAPERMCSQVLREQGKPYPKTCAVHGLGPCQPKPEPVKVDPPKVAPKIGPCQVCGTTGIHACPGKRSEGTKWTEKDKQRLADAVGKIRDSEAGFVSIYELRKQRGGSRATGTFITINGNGQLSMSAKLPFVTGDNIDIQIDPTRGLIRLGKVKEGGRPLAKTRMVSFKVLCDLFRIPEGEKSVRVYLTEADGWWQGQAELAGVKS